MVNSGAFSLVWRVEIDPATGDAKSDDSKFWVKRLDSTTYGTQSFFIGMRNELEYDSTSGNYYIHAIYTMMDQLGFSTTFYIRVSPDVTGTVFI